jgi:TonB family protein
MSNKVKSGIGTAIIMALIAVVLLAFGYHPPDPPIPEEGVEVNIGDSDFGLGSDPEPASEASSYAPPAAQNQVATQHTEPSVSMPSTPNQGTVTNPAAQEPPQVENKEPEINKNALFTGRRNRTNQGGTGSEGNTSGAGNQGNPNGTPNSNNYNGNGGSGSNFSLKGRSAVSLPKPDYNSNQQGKIVIDIWVNQQGQVTRVEGPAQGSTLTNSAMVEQAKKAARKARFNADAAAPEEQKGTITYIFKI